MKRKFTVVITREGTEYVARCQEVADAVARGSSNQDALEKIKAVIRKKFEDGSEGGSAPLPHPVSPPPRGPRGPIMVETEIDDQNDAYRLQGGDADLNSEPNNWPFDQPRYCGAVTTPQILDGLEGILLVSHDDADHGWQFIGVTNASIADGRIACLEEIVRLDPTVLEVAHLPPGWQAIRAEVGGPWSRRLRPPD
jgi:predicted RNase H-like HicB family nuclease